jgi:Fe-S-cluster containining protein
MDASLKRRVLELYADVEREVATAGPVCVASGRCCRFKEYGHVLYLSSLEANVLLDAAPAHETPVTPEFCPFQKENLCTAREPRPLACRIYFCDPAYQETGNRITEQALERLKVLCETEDITWRYAPLHHFLNHPEDARPTPV